MILHIGFSTHFSRRAAAAGICALLTLSLLLCAAFILAERHHDCTGERCEICRAISHTVAFLKTEVSAYMPVLAIFVSFRAVAFLFSRYRPADLPKQSPVSLRVKLSD